MNTDMQDSSVAGVDMMKRLNAEALRRGEKIFNIKNIPKKVLIFQESGVSMSCANCNNKCGKN